MWPHSSNNHNLKQHNMFSESSQPWSSVGGATARTENLPNDATNDESDDEINEPKPAIKA